MRMGARRTQKAGTVPAGLRGARQNGRNSCTVRGAGSPSILRHPRVMAASSPRDDSVLTPDVDPSAQATPVDAAAPKPDLSRTERALESRRARSVGLTTLT